MQKLNNQFLCSRMMLPEHVEALAQYNKERQKEEITIPSVDEQELELWERRIIQSLELGKEITITYLANSEIKSVSGVVKRVNRSAGMILIAGKRIEMGKVVEIKE
ncbi:MAG: YolD-like family protein [Firmicutes bacterium]|nr:YolD-like family protein [Bacillota bacterium]